MKEKQIKKQGFTLLEVLLVVAIIAILAAIVILALNPAMMLKKTRDSQRYTDIKTLDNAIQQYIIDNGHAPYLQDNCGPDNPDNNCFANETGYPRDMSDLQTDLTDYIVAVPHDPCGANCYKESTETTPAMFYTYIYYAPSVYVNQCNNEGNCGTYSQPLREAQSKTMYAVYAEHLEVSDDSWGMSHNQFHSY